MRLNVTPKWSLTVLGDARAIFNTLRTPEKIFNQKFYDQWLNTREPFYPEDPDSDSCGVFEIENLNELMELLGYLSNLKGRELEIVSLNLSGKDNGISVNAALIDRITNPEYKDTVGIEIDEKILNLALFDAIKRAHDILDDVVEGV